MKAEDASFLADLAQALREILSSRGLTQSMIEQATGVDQTTISRARAGKLKRVTNKLRRLHSYACMRHPDFTLSVEVDRAAKRFLAAGGNEAELLASIEHAITLVTRRLT